MSYPYYQNYFLISKTNNPIQDLNCSKLDFSDDSITFLANIHIFLEFSTKKCKIQVKVPLQCANQIKVPLIGGSTSGAKIPPKRSKYEIFPPFGVGFSFPTSGVPTRGYNSSLNIPVSSPSFDIVAGFKFPRFDI